MKSMSIKSLTLIAFGFVVGIAASSFPVASKPPVSDAIDPGKKTFIISIDEIRQSFVFADRFTGTYEKSVTLSDGSVRNIALRPLMKDGRLAVEFRDNDGMTFMGPNGTSTNGTLMVQLRDVDAIETSMVAAR